MTKEELKEAFFAECTGFDLTGNRTIKGTPAEIVNWIADRIGQSALPPFSRAFTGMHDKNDTPIHEGDNVKIYYKGTHVICQVVYDVKHAAFFIKWPDGYINQYFMNGSSYEIVADNSR